MTTATNALSGLDLLATAVMVVDQAGYVRYINPAAENLFGLSNRNAEGAHLETVFKESFVLTAAVAVFSGEAPPPALDDVAAGISPNAAFLIYGEQGQAGEELNVDYFEAADEPKELWEVPGAGHTGGLDSQPGEYESRVSSFFERYLGAAGPTN